MGEDEGCLASSVCELDRDVSTDEARESEEEWDDAG